MASRIRGHHQVRRCGWQGVGTAGKRLGTVGPWSRLACTTESQRAANAQGWDSENRQVLPSGNIEATTAMF